MNTTRFSAPHRRRIKRASRALRRAWNAPDRDLGGPRAFRIDRAHDRLRLAMASARARERRFMISYPGEWVGYFRNLSPCQEKCMYENKHANRMAAMGLRAPDRRLIPSNHACFDRGPDDIRISSATANGSDGPYRVGIEYAVSSTNVCRLVLRPDKHGNLTEWRIRRTGQTEYVPLSRESALANNYDVRPPNEEHGYSWGEPYTFPA